MQTIADRRRRRNRARTSDQPAVLVSRIDHLVERRELLDDLTSRLTKARGGSRTVALTTALRGAGGFGKTTLAVQACRQLKAQFPDGILWCTVGQHTAGAELTGKIN